MDLYYWLIMAWITYSGTRRTYWQRQQSAPSQCRLGCRFYRPWHVAPRLTTAQRNGISNPAPGLVIYNTSSQCLEVYLPQSGWNQAICDCVNPPSAAISSSQGSNLGLNQSSMFTATQPGNISSYQWAFSGVLRLLRWLPIRRCLGARREPIG